MGKVRAHAATCIVRGFSSPFSAARRTDLRLSAPFPELLEVAAAHPWAGDDEASRKRRHDLPWPLILLEAAQRWKEQNDGAAPKGMSGKAKFRQLIQVRASPAAHWWRCVHTQESQRHNIVSMCRVWQIHLLKTRTPTKTLNRPRRTPGRHLSSPTCMT